MPHRRDLSVEEQAVEQAGTDHEAAPASQHRNGAASDKRVV
jgi:hypothetical protein